MFEGDLSVTVYKQRLRMDINLLQEIEVRVTTKAFQLCHKVKEVEKFTLSKSKQSQRLQRTFLSMLWVISSNLNLSSFPRG